MIAHPGTVAPDTPSAMPPSEAVASKQLLDRILKCLDDAKAEDTVVIDLQGKSSIGDHMVVTSGRSQRHVGAIADQLQRALKEAGAGRPRVEGIEQSDWVLIDSGDVVVHVFRPEVRDFYKLEKMWMTDRPSEDHVAVQA